jgi:uncharacterized phage-like protein YoqJ
VEDIVTCCFTGHRPEKLPWRDAEDDPRCLALKERLARAVETAYERGARHFMCGMARGADFYFCEAVLALRLRHPHITLEAVIPFQGQHTRWGEQDKTRYCNLLAQCDRQTLVQQRYDRGCMLRRNRYMVDRSQLLLAVYDGMQGGTMYTIAYAMRHQVEVTILEIEEE